MATFIVTTTVDENDASATVSTPGGAGLSLREAIALANENSGEDTITFAAGAGEAFVTDAVIRLTQGEIEITEETIIDGSTAGGTLTITGDSNNDDITFTGTDITDVAATLASTAADTDGVDNDGDGDTDGADEDGETLLDDNSRLFISIAETEFKGLTLTGGRTTSSASTAENDGANGGAQDAEAIGGIPPATAVAILIGTIGLDDAGGGGRSRSEVGGGAIVSDSTVTLTNSTLSGNSTMSGNAQGGGVLADTLFLTNSTVTGNATEGNFANGGGIYALTLYLNNSTVSGNSTVGDNAHGGGIHAENAVTLENSTVSGNSTAGNNALGGGIDAESATLTNSTVSGNSTAGNSAAGGGIFAGTATLNNSTVSGNSTAEIGAEGGGIFAYNATLTNSTVSDNSTAGDSASGGGVFSYYGATLTNSTVSGNSTAGDSASGGGVFSYYGATLTNSTVSGNSTAGGSSPGGGIHTSDGAELTNSLVLGNVSDQTDFNETSGALTLQGGNIVGTDVFDGTTDIGDTTAANVFAATTETLTDDDGDGTPEAGTGVYGGVLADNVGPVETMALLAAATNPALDVAAKTASLTTDATGSPRELDFAGIGNDGTDFVDLGAVELPATAAETPSLEVTITSDTVDLFDGETSLREAIAFANANPDQSTITFAAGSGEAFETDAVIRLTQGEIVITQATIIDGSKAGGELVITGDADGDDNTVAGTDITDVAVSGAALLDDNSRLFLLDGADADTTFDSLILTGGRTTADLKNGGAIRADDADVTLTNSTVSGNSTVGKRADGGGIYADTATLTNSTVSGNSTAGNSAAGGGIFAGTATLTNSTVSGNSTAGDSASGGGIYTDIATLTNSTVSGNSTAGNSAAGGGIFAFNTATLTNSLVIGNVSAQTADDETGGTLTLQGGNIVGTDVFDGTTEIGDTTAADVFAATTETLTDDDGDGTPEAGTRVYYGVLADNGGPVETVALWAAATNPALDAGDDTQAAPTDARGMTWFDQAFVANNGTNISDLGAFELQGGIVNDPPTLTLTPVVTSLEEDTTLANRLKVADLAITDDALGTNVLTLNGTDADKFELDGTELFLKAGTSLNFEQSAQLDVVVEVDDPSLGPTFEDSAAFALTLLDVNEAPSVGLRFTTSELAEDTDTNEAIRVGTIRITDDALGANTLSLSGSDANLFEIDGRALFLRTGAVLDFETNPVLDVTVNVSDSSIPASSGASLSINLTDVNEAPEFDVTQTRPVLPEGYYGPERTAVATVDVIDDGPGTNMVALDGEDAKFFQLEDNTLFLKAGLPLASTLMPTLHVELTVDDPALGAGPEDSLSLSFLVPDTTQSGRATDDLLIGTAYGDVLSGYGGNDTLVGLQGDDVLDGGAGTGDVAVFTGPAERYTVVMSSDGVIVTDRREDGDGSDTLVDIETIRFAADPAGDPDAGTDFYLDSYAGAINVIGEQIETITQFYIGLFDRVPDAQGLFFWATKLAEGVPEDVIADAFIDSPEATAIYGAAPTSSEIVTGAYQNLLDRDADLAGSFFWTNLLEQGILTPAQFFTQFAAGVEAPTGSSADRTTLDDQTDIGIYFSAIKGLSDVADASDALAVYDLNDRNDSLDEAKDLIDDFATEATSTGSDAFLIQITGIIDDPFASVA